MIISVLFSAFVCWLRLFRVRTLKNLRQRATFLHGDTRNRYKCRGDVFDAGLFIDLLPLAVMMPNQILNEARNHLPVLGAHVHRGGYLDIATDGMAMMGHSVHYRPARARRQSQTVLGPPREAPNYQAATC